MEAKAIAKFVRIAPRKVGVVLDLIRGKDAKYAEAVLKHTPKAASEPLLKLLNSAMANAENNHDMDVSRLYVAECNATAGPILKRIRPRAQGRAFRINKRTSHISLVLKEKEAKGRFKYGSEINPHGLRVGVIKDWDSRWLQQEELWQHSLRTITSVKHSRLSSCNFGIAKIEIERDGKKG